MNKNNGKNLPEGWEIRIVESLDEIETIRLVWEQMQTRQDCPMVDSDIDRYLSVVKSSEEKVTPYIIIFYYEGKPVVMIIARIEMHKLVVTLGYKKLFKPKLKCLLVTYGGILGEINSDTSSLIIRELKKQLRYRKVDMVYFHRLEDHSLIYEKSKSIPGIFTRSHFTVHEKHWVMSVPENIEHFYQLCSSVSRKQYKKIKRKLEQEYSDRIKIVIYSQEDEIDEGLKAVERISRTTYQWGLGCGFKDDYKNRILLTTAARKGWLRLYILYIDGEPCAFENWIKYNDRYEGNGIGFDPKWKKWRIGTYLFLNTIEQVCNDNSVKIIDFGFGDAEYKQSYGNTSWDEVSAYIFAPRFYPVLVNAVRTFFAGIEVSAKYILKKSGFIEIVKRSWRKRLAKNMIDKSPSDH